jgi:glycosyltransferase involved in cell wall biosynthesis
LSRSKSILYISHDASRTGAPIIFLNFLNWFKDKTDFPYNILIGRDDGPRGELITEFQNLAEVQIFNKRAIFTPFGPLTNAINHYASSINNYSHHRILKKVLSNYDIGLIYSNTIVNGHILDFLSFLKCPVITHVHELNFLINHGFGSENLRLVRKHTTKYIAVSNAVKNSLMNDCEIPENDIEIVYGFTPIDEQRVGIKSGAQNSIAKKYKIPNNAFIIGASGTIEWRKGPDLFIQLAKAVFNRNSEDPIHFIWVGGTTEKIYYQTLLHDLAKLGLEDHVHFTGVCDNPFDYFELFDVFTLISREDPFPLVMLENASLANPIVCFNKSGGAHEFVKDDCGFVVPYLDIEAMADKIIELKNKPKLRKALGKSASQRVRDKHSIDISAHNILEIINRFV